MGVVMGVSVGMVVGRVLLVVVVEVVVGRVLVRVVLLRVTETMVVKRVALFSLWTCVGVGCVSGLFVIYIALYPADADAVGNWGGEEAEEGGEHTTYVAKVADWPDLVIVPV